MNPARVALSKAQVQHLCWFALWDYALRSAKYQTPNCWKMEKLLDNDDVDHALNLNSSQLVPVFHRYISLSDISQSFSFSV